MYVIASVIARLGSKRLTYKNILPFQGIPLIGNAILTLKKSQKINQVIVSTESELIARIAIDFGATILRRPPQLSADNIPSIPVFEHIVDNFPCDLHINYNCNFPICPVESIDRFIDLGLIHGEVLSNPYALWAQTPSVIKNYKDPWNITAKIINDPSIHPLDIHTEQDLLQLYKETQGSLPQWNTESSDILNFSNISR